jgi:hypothetical protein
MSYFLDSAEDARKVLVFNDHPDLWKRIEKEVMAWTLENWHKWEEEEPDFFNDNFKANVPDDFIPRASLDALNKKHGGKRRRSQRSGRASPRALS